MSHQSLFSLLSLCTTLPRTIPHLTLGLVSCCFFNSATSFLLSLLSSTVLSGHRYYTSLIPSTSLSSPDLARMHLTMSRL